MFVLLSVIFQKFQISCQRTDLIRQKSFSFLKKCFKRTQISDFSDVIYRVRLILLKCCCENVSIRHVMLGE